MKMSVYPVTSRLIQKFVTERVHGNFHVSCHIEFNLKKLLPKGSMEISLYLSQLNAFFLAMVHGYVHVHNITVK